MDRKELKIQALRERVSSLTTDYEDQVANLRVELTIVSQERDELAQRVKELEEVVQDNQGHSQERESAPEPD